MDRRIKFRARQKDTMLDWACLTQTAFNRADFCLLYRAMTDPQFILMQYTGLRDSGGREIYEGDIVDFTYWWFDGNEAEIHLTGEVVYLPESMSFGLKGVKNADWIRHIGGKEGESDTAPFAAWTFSEADFEVIGNIYETPELLEKVA